MTSLTVLLCVATWIIVFIKAAPTLPESIQEFDEGANQVFKNQVVKDEARSPVKSGTKELAQGESGQSSAEVDFSSGHMVSLTQSSNEDFTVDGSPEHRKSEGLDALGLVSRVSELLDSIIDVKTITRSLPMRQSVFTELDQIRQDERYWEALEDYVDTVCSRLKRTIKQQRAKLASTVDPTSSSSENTTVVSHSRRVEQQPLTTMTTPEPNTSTTTIVSSSPYIKISTIPGAPFVSQATTELTTQDPPAEITSTTVFSIPQSTKRPELERKVSVHEVQVLVQVLPENLVGSNVEDVQKAEQHQQHFELIETTTDPSQSSNTTKSVVSTKISTEKTIIFAALPQTSSPEDAVDPATVDNVRTDRIVKEGELACEGATLDTARQLIGTVVGPKYSSVESVKLVDTSTLLEKPAPSPMTPSITVSLSSTTETDKNVMTSTVQPETPLLHSEQATQQKTDPLVPVESARIITASEKSAVSKADRNTTQTVTDALAPVSVQILHSSPIVQPVAPMAPVASDSFATAEPSRPPGETYDAQSHISSPTPLLRQSTIPVSSSIFTDFVPTSSQSTTIIPQAPTAAAAITSFSLGTVTTMKPVAPVRPTIVTQDKPEVIVFRPVVQPFLLRTVNLPKQLAHATGKNASLKLVESPVEPVKVISPVDAGMSKPEEQRHLTEVAAPTVLG